MSIPPRDPQKIIPWLFPVSKQLIFPPTRVWMKNSGRTISPRSFQAKLFRQSVYKMSYIYMYRHHWRPTCRNPGRNIMTCLSLSTFMIYVHKLPSHSYAILRPMAGVPAQLGNVYIYYSACLRPIKHRSVRSHLISILSVTAPPRSRSAHCFPMFWRNVKNNYCSQYFTT